MADFEVELEVKLLPPDAAEVGFNSGLGVSLPGREGQAEEATRCEIDLQEAGRGVSGSASGGWIWLTAESE